MTRCKICDWSEGEGVSSLFSQTIPHSKDNTINPRTGVCTDCTPVEWPRKAVQKKIDLPGTLPAKLDLDALDPIPAPLLDPLFDEA